MGAYEVVGDLDVLFELDDRCLIISHSRFTELNKYDGKAFSELLNDVRTLYPVPESEFAEQPIRDVNKHFPVEDQLMVLSDLEIRPNRNDFVEWICHEWGGNAVEANPYNLMLFSLGGERHVYGGTLTYSFDNIYFFDLECIKDSNIYTSVPELSRTNKLRINFTNSEND